MHHANKTSPRLNRVYQFLRKCGRRGATTREIQSATGSQAVGTCVSEIRAWGKIIRCDYEMQTAAGGKVYRYRLLYDEGDTSLTLPANSLVAGRSIRVTVRGYVPPADGGEVTIKEPRRP